MARPKKNNADYFSHDAEMRNDRKVKSLFSKFSHLGYSIWCQTLETLCGSNNFFLIVSEAEIELLASDMFTDSKNLKEILDYIVLIGLLQREGDKIRCQKLIDRLQPMIDKRIKMKQKYDLGGVSEEETTISEEETTISASETTQSKVKESKEEKDTTSKGEVEVFGNQEISKLIELVKEKVESQGFVYDPKDQRNFGKHLLSKNFKEVIVDRLSAKMNKEMNVEKTIRCIFQIVGQKENWRHGKVNSVRFLYQNASKILNSAM